MNIADVAERSTRLLDEVERAVVGKRDALELVLLGRARRRPRADRGLPRSRQDADRAVVRAGDRARLRTHPVHARPDALRRHRLVDLQPAHGRLRVPARADLHEPPPRRRDQPRPTEDPGGAARGDAGAAGDDRGPDPLRSTARSSCSPPRTRSSTRAPIRCRRRSSTASCCASPSATPRARTSSAILEQRRDRREDDVVLDRSSTPPTLREMQQALEDVHVAESIGYYIVDVVRATRDAASVRSARARAGRSRS